jgi:hypothetical protein
MAFECIPYGTNVSANIYIKLNQFYNHNHEGCCGCMETVGKWILVAPAHLLTGIIAVPLLMIYDLAMTCFFTLANLCTLCMIEELRDRFCGHLFSLFSLPNDARTHVIAGLCTPIAYHGQNVIAQQQWAGRFR